MKSLARLLAWRYLFSSRLRFSSLLTGVSLGGIALGVWSLIVVLGVMRGFQKELNHRWVGLNAHFTLSNLSIQGESTHNLLNKIREWPSVQEITAFAEGEVIVQVLGEAENLSLAAKVRGVDRIRDSFKMKVDIAPLDATHFTMMMGDDLATTLGVHPSFEDPLTLIYPFGEIGPTGDFVPKKMTLSLSHLFRTGIYEWDAFRILIPLQKALDLLGERAETGIKIHLHDVAALPEVLVALEAILPEETRIVTFYDQNKRLFAALKLERLAMTGLLILFAIIASFSVIGLLLMFITAKQRDMAILRGIGLPLKGVRRIFLKMGGILGGLGALIGALLGLATSLLLKNYPIPLPSTYYLDFLPVFIPYESILFIMFLGFVLAMISSWYPVRMASNMEILPMLREE